MSKPKMLGTGLARAKSAQIDAVVIRADGTRVDLGTVSYWHKNPLRRMLWRLRYLLGL